MSDDQEHDQDARFWRRLGTICLALLAVGFGAFGACGIKISAEGIRAMLKPKSGPNEVDALAQAFMIFSIPCAVVGVVGGVYLVRAVVRRIRS